MYSYVHGVYTISISDRQDPTNIVLSQSYTITMPRQTHSCDVVICHKAWWYAQISADALVSDHVTIWVWWSDCNLIAILGKKHYAVCHAGWKWLYSGILQHTLDTLLWLGEEKFDLQIILWPSIRRCCFEIGEELVWLREGYREIREGKYYVDMIWYIYDILSTYHIYSDRIYDYGSCTKCHPQQRRSHRNRDLYNQALRITKHTP